MIPSKRRDAAPGGKSGGDVEREQEDKPRGGQSGAQNPEVEPEKKDDDMEGEDEEGGGNRDTLT
jgi:hypothetical protein